MKCLEKLSEKQAKRITVVLLILGIALLACTAILTIGSGKGYEVTTYSMGSYVRQTVYGKEREEAARQAANAVAGLEDLISWRVEDSDIQKLNAQAGKEFIPIESQTWQLLKLSLSVCEASSGAFDITIAPLSQLWDFDDNPHLPKPSLIKAMLPQVDYSTLSLLEDGTAALKGINLRAERGKITGILGANGAGKSTLFLNLNGVLQPSDGEILLDGVPVKRDRKGLTELRRRVGIVFQDPDDQLFSADVYRDISFGAVNLGLPEAEVRRRVEAAMERTGVSHLRDKPTHALSFGQKKRVAIAGVLVMEPEALILDEPTAGLDPQGVSDLLELLTSLRDSQGMTILMATHDMDVVPLCCDYAYLLGGGSVLAQGTPEELFTKAELLRANHLRLPRIAHLMAILRDRDGLDVTPVGTIGAARRELLRLLKQEELL